MAFLKKYMLLLFLTANATAEYILFMSISKYMFYGVLALSIPFVLSKNVLSWEALKKCPAIYALSSVLIVYQFSLGFVGATSESWLYLVAKLATFGVMVLCIGEDFIFYFKKFVLKFSYVILALIILGWFVNSHGLSDRMYTFGYINRNVACTLASIGFAGFLFGKEHHSKFDLLGMSILFITILIGGSRNALAMSLIFMAIRYGMSFRLVFVMSVLGIVIVYLLPDMGISIDAFTRLTDTVSGELATDREVQRQGAMMMIEAKPWTGWGLGAKISGEALEVSHYGAHNGYLTFLMYMGYIFGGGFLTIIAVAVIKRLKLYKLHDNYYNYHLAVIASVLFAANQEDYLVGVNQIATNMFFLSFVVTGFYLYYYNNDELLLIDSQE